MQFPIMYIRTGLILIQFTEHQLTCGVTVNKQRSRYIACVLNTFKYAKRYLNT